MFLELLWRVERHSVYENLKTLALFLILLTFELLSCIRSYLGLFVLCLGVNECYQLGELAVNVEVGRLGLFTALAAVTVRVCFSAHVIAKLKC